MIYLDNAATTQPLPSAAEAALLACREHWHNPSAAYREGLRAEALIDAARADVRRALRLDESRRVFFTSGGTEALNTAMLGLTLPKKRNRVLVSPLEHPAVSQTLPELQARGLDIVFLPVTPAGIIDAEAALNLIDEQTALLCLMHVNNEIGSVQPVAPLARRASQLGAVVAVDGVQGFLHVPLALDDIDAYALSAHKVHGLKGTGALALSSRARLTPRALGGGQENGLRSGTENVPGIAALRGAIAALPADFAAALRSLKLSLWHEISARLPNVVCHGPAPESPESAPHILSIGLPNARGEVLLHALEDDDVLVSTGAACATRRKNTVSPTLQAISAPHAQGTLRFSLGVHNAIDEMAPAAEALARAMKRYF